MRQKHLHW